MMHENEIAIFLQSLRGSQAVVALAYLFLRRALTVEDLVRVTGLNHKSIRDGVKGLASKGLLYRQRGEHGRETWLPAGDTFFGGLAAESQNLVTCVDQNPKIWESGALFVDVAESKSSLPTYTTLTTNRGQNPKKRESAEKVLDARYSQKTRDDVEACRAALGEAGICGKKAELLAWAEHVTPEYIRAHVAWTKQGDWQNPLGMAIYRMEQGISAPELAEGGHVVGCACRECQLQRALKKYSDGPWNLGGQDDDQESE
ncbi:MAG: MarR family transcriptional regulator [Chloroflexota bacterium]